jgi:hypothetical protein
MASGILWMRNQNGTVGGFSSQFAGCSAPQKKNFKRLVLLSAGLDAGYIAAGVWLATQPPKQGDKLEERHVSFRNGVGLGIVAQGAFLLIWDILLSLLAHKGRNA